MTLREEKRISTLNSRRVNRSRINFVGCVTHDSRIIIRIALSELMMLKFFRIHYIFETHEARGVMCSRVEYHIKIFPFFFFPELCFQR